jgi:hypothetical protein
MFLGLGFIIAFLITYAFADKGSAPFVFFLLVLGFFTITISLSVFIRKRNYLLRYYWLDSVVGKVAPIDAELKYKNVSTGRWAYDYFYFCQVAPNSNWPTDFKERIQIDPPLSAYGKLVDKHPWFGQNQPLWGKVYFDPDKSGNAVIRIDHCIFVSVQESNI